MNVIVMTGNGSKPKTIRDVQQYLAGRGLTVYGGNVVVGRDDRLVGILEEEPVGYVFLTFSDPQLRQQVGDSIAIAKEYGLPVVPSIGTGEDE